MGCKQTELVPNDLEAAKKRFDAWRRARKLGTRIPDHLWDCATKLAAEYGVARVAQVLRLDYYGLKKRLQDGSSTDIGQMVSPATFVELSPPATYASPECVIELANPHGSKMRVYLKGNHVAEVVELCRDFWDVEG